MIRAFRDWFLDQLGLYAAYHTDWRNQLTHYVGVPIIIFSILIVLDQVPIGGRFSAALLVLGLLLVSYLIAAPLVGLASTLVCFPLYLLMESVATLSAVSQWAIAGACFAIGWIIQFIGHAFEGRRPAFTVNGLQVLVAPAFLVAELLFAAGLQRDLAGILEAKARKYARS